MSSTEGFEWNVFTPRDAEVRIIAQLYDTRHSAIELSTVLNGAVLTASHSSEVAGGDDLGHACLVES